jgi:hypothetical protein
MVLVMARREAALHEKKPKTLKRELKTTLWSQGDLVGILAKWQPTKIQLTLSQSKKKNGDKVTDDEDADDYVVRTSVSQDRVTGTLYTKELFLSTQYIFNVALPAYHIVNYLGAEDTNGQHNTFGRPSWVSHLPAIPHHGLQIIIRTAVFIQLFCD